MAWWAFWHAMKSLPLFYEVYLQEFFYFNTFFPRMNDGMAIHSRIPLMCRCRCSNFPYFKDKMQKICWIRLWHRSFVKRDAKHGTTCISLIPYCSKHYCTNTIKQKQKVFVLWYFQQAGLDWHQTSLTDCFSPQNLLANGISFL